MKRNYWDPEALMDARDLLETAIENLETNYPHSKTRPNPNKIDVVRDCIKKAVELLNSVEPSK